MMSPLLHSHEEKISPTCVRRGLIEFSTMSNGCTSVTSVAAPQQGCRYRFVCEDGGMNSKSAPAARYESAIVQKAAPKPK